ncbi:MAG: UDP-N-acetylglucosamine 1-carboxyvinyltransferase [Blautia massiliensis (ex Durand et al. 2017)]
MEYLNEIDEIIVTGGRPLHGSVRIQGSKNAALPVMAAALLSTGTSVLRGCPRISDVYLMEKILKYLGAETWWEGQDLYLDCSHADGTMIPECYSGKMRSSVILMGAMLGRSKKAQTGYPGGCVIGKRPVDLHIQVLRRLGAAVVENGGMIRASCGKLRGAEMFFQKRSVGATEQGILAAVLAEGKTVLNGCACEPEIYWLCHYLTGMGAKIRIRENGCICIEGVEKLEAGDELHSTRPYCRRNLSHGSGGNQRRDHPGKSASGGNGWNPGRISENGWTMPQGRW